MPSLDLKRLKRSDPEPANNDELYSDLNFCHSMISVGSERSGLGATIIRAVITKTQSVHFELSYRYVFYEN